MLIAAVNTALRTQKLRAMALAGVLRAALGSDRVVGATLIMLGGLHSWAFNLGYLQPQC